MTSTAHCIKPTQVGSPEIPAPPDLASGSRFNGFSPVSPEIQLANQRGAEALCLLQPLAGLIFAGLTGLIFAGLILMMSPHHMMSPHYLPRRWRALSCAQPDRGIGN
jgi:hypothetical protein